MGNLRSVQKALQSLGYEAEFCSSIGDASHAILPGVGAFGAAMERLNRGMADDIRSFVAAGGKLLGICLGQQLLFEVSDEFGETTGLGLLGGRVKYLPPMPGIKIPHVGWNGLYSPTNLPPPRGGGGFEGALATEKTGAGSFTTPSPCPLPLGSGGEGVIVSHLNPGDQVYFVHSLYTDCADPSDIAAVSTHGITFPAAVQRGNVWGAQFHPEKSSAVGMRILRNFLES